MLKELVKYQWSLYQGGVDKLTYFYADGTNETFYRSVGCFNGVSDLPFWMLCLGAVVVVAVTVTCLCIFKNRCQMSYASSNGIILISRFPDLMDAL